MKSRFQVRFDTKTAAGKRRLEWPSPGVGRGNSDHGNVGAGSRQAGFTPGAERAKSPRRPGSIRAAAVEHCVLAILALTLDCAPAEIRREASLSDLGADDLDVEEIVDTCETLFGLDRESVWSEVPARPCRLTVARFTSLFERRLADD